jgi:sodium/potassium-transporting ATPase subunit alpha
MRIHELSPLDAVASLKSTAEGLSRSEVQRRLHEFGRNGVEAVPRKPLWLRLGKYPPAEPGALDCEPPKAAGRGR